MAQLFLALFLALSKLTSAAYGGKQGAFLANGLQPEVVARTLSRVEDEWKAQAAVFAQCNGTSELPGASIVNCADAPSSFAKSCKTVVSAIIQGSGGDKDVAKEYMDDVCSQSSVSGWHQTQCQTLALSVRNAMTADKYRNREGFDSEKLCGGVWARFLKEDRERTAKEMAEREAEEKKDVEEAAEKDKQHLEELKKQAERKKAEEAEHAKQEAAAKAAEAKAKAAESAAKSAVKQVEAAAASQAAKEKAVEAEAAELAHKKAVAAHKQVKTEPAIVSTKDAANSEKVVHTTKEAVATPTKEVQVAPKMVKEAAPAKVDQVTKPSLLEQDPCAGCDTALAQAYQTCAMKHGNPCAETNDAGLVTSGPGTKKDVGCCMKKEKHDRCLQCSTMDCAHKTCNVNKKYYKTYAIKEGLDDKKAMKKSGWGL